MHGGVTLGEPGRGRSRRRVVRPSGTVLVVNKPAEETFTAPGGDDVPQGRFGADPKPAGRLIRSAYVRDLAHGARCSRVGIVRRGLFSVFDRLTA
jgi:hypothetical protein